MTVTVTTGASTTTWTVTLPCGGPLESDQPCHWVEMHHYDESDDGTQLVHRCPTGFVWCTEHGGVGTIDGPGACHLWDEPLTD